MSSGRVLGRGQTDGSVRGRAFEPLLASRQIQNFGFGCRLESRQTFRQEGQVPVLVRDEVLYDAQKNPFIFFQRHGDRKLPDTVIAQPDAPLMPLPV